jgi:hypothetical protein
VQYYRTIERTFEAGERPSLRIANRAGELTVIGEDRADIALKVQVAVEAVGPAEGEARLDQVAIPMSESSGRVEIGPPEHEEPELAGMRVFGIKIGIHGLRGTRIDMQVRVPRDCSVEVSHRSGPLRVVGVRRGVRAESRSGRTEIQDIVEDVFLESRSGASEISKVRGRLYVDSRAGKVEVEDIEGDVKVVGRSGMVSVRQVRGNVSVATRAGRIQLEDVQGAVEAQGHSGTFEYRGRIEHPMTIELHSGAVRLGVTAASSFYLDAETHAGSIRSELPVDYVKPPEPGAPTVRVRTHAASIRVVPA